MSDQRDDVLLAWWAKNLDEVDREVARLSMLCQVKILEPGVIERVLQRDASVCGAHNPIAFAKLHDMLMLHYAEHKKSAEALGQLQTGRIEAQIIERLKKAYAAFGLP
jgi:hypothetical protein